MNIHLPFQSLQSFEETNPEESHKGEKLSGRDLERIEE